MRILRTRPVACLRVVGLLLAAFACQATGATPSRPNVLVILADDMGFADLNINNPQAGSPTPHLNELAATGVRFTRHYTESTCAPSRAALLTGRYPARANFKPNGFGIPIELETMPKAFQAAGYRTHQIGKWHLGHLVPEAWPTAQGFDTWLGFLNQWLMVNPDRSHGFQYGSTTHNNVWLQDESGAIRQYPGHLTDVSTDEAIRRIEADKDVPWFIYLAYFAPHEPMQPRADYAARFPDTPAGRYRALIAHLDDRVADVIAALKRTGQYERTIVVFASDNGGTNKRLDSNQPYRGTKSEYLEGGIRTPLMISWPGKVPAQGTTDQIVSIMDIYPTVATLARVPFDARRLDGRALFAPSGVPIDHAPPRALYWDMSAGIAKRYGALSADGRWRLYQDWGGAPALFDLAADPITAVDVAATHPDVVQHLQAGFEQWEVETGRIQTEFAARDAGGHGAVSGDRLQRNAAFADFTIAIGVSPTSAATQRQTILAQEPTLSVDADAAGTHVRLHQFATDLPALPAGKCSSLILTGTFNRKIENQDFGPSTLNVYVDGERVRSLELNTPLLQSTDLSAATLVGAGPNGEDRFEGTLSVPIYLNRRADTHAPPAQGVAALAREVCPTTAATKSPRNR